MIFLTPEEVTVCCDGGGREVTGEGGGGWRVVTVELVKVWTEAAVPEGVCREEEGN